MEIYRVQPNREDVKATHTAGLEIANAVKQDYEERFGTTQVIKQEPSTTKSEREVEPHDLGFDAGGMALAAMPVLAVEAGGLRLGFPADQAEELLDALRRNKVRNHGDVSYHKVHGKWNCFCIPAELMPQLIAALEANLERAEKVSDTVFEAWKKNHTNP